MFQALSEGSVIPAQAQHIVGLHRSLNTPTLLLAGGESLPCAAYIVGVANPEGTYTFYVTLKPLERAQSLLFRSDPSVIPVVQYRPVERAALALVERYGFKMERVELGQLSPALRLQHLGVLPLSAQPSASSMSVSAQPSRSSSPQVRSTEQMPAVPHSTSARLASSGHPGATPGPVVGAPSRLARSRQEPGAWGVGMLETGAARSGEAAPMSESALSASPSVRGVAEVGPLAPTTLLPKVSGSAAAVAGASSVAPEEAISVLGRLLASF